MFVECDCALLGVPNYAVDDETADRLFLRVQHFSAVALPDHPATLRVPSHIEELLWANNAGPSFDQISEFLELMDLGHVYSAHDLLKLYNQILTNSLRCEFHTPCMEEIEDCSINPALPNGLTPIVLGNATSRSILECAYRNEIGEQCIIASAFTCDEVMQFEVTFTTTDGEGVSGFALVAPSVSALAGRGYEIWSKSSTELSRILSLAVGAAERSHGGSTLRFAFSDGFFASAEALSALRCGRNSANLFAILTALIAENCGNDRHEYGVAEPLVRSVDGAVAWRLHVTKSHGALRLMYWLKDGCIEFANLDLKADIRILGEEREALRTYSVDEILHP